MTIGIETQTAENGRLCLFFGLAGTSKNVSGWLPFPQGGARRRACRWADIRSALWVLNVESGRPPNSKAKSLAHTDCEQG